MQVEREQSASRFEPPPGVDEQYSPREPDLLPLLAETRNEAARAETVLEWPIRIAEGGAVLAPLLPLLGQRTPLVPSDQGPQQLGFRR